MNLPALPSATVGRESEWTHLQRFVGSGLSTPTLGIVWGRRRIGKSHLLTALCHGRGGFYHQALRSSGPQALRDLGARLADHVGAPAPLDLPDWTAAVDAMLRLPGDEPFPIVLDEYPYLLEGAPELNTVLQRALAPQPGQAGRRPARLILCGSAMGVMRHLLIGTAPLRGRAGLDLRMSALDFRAALELHGRPGFELATQIHAVIGGVPAYARDMVDGDLPQKPSEFDAWVARRVLSPASPLFREADLLLAEDPTTSSARKINLYHSTLASVSNGHHAYARLSRQVGVSGPSLAPILNALVDAELVERVQDPLREQRPSYHPADALLRFHYAILRPNLARFAQGEGLEGWRSLKPTFLSRVAGPAFEQLARTWVRVYARTETLGGAPQHVGPSVVNVNGVDRALDVVVAAGDGTPVERQVLAIGEAKLAERLSDHHLRALQAAREALGGRAAGAKLLLVGQAFSSGLLREAKRRADIELVDLERLYTGA